MPLLLRHYGRQNAGARQPPPRECTGDGGMRKVMRGNAVGAFRRRAGTPDRTRPTRGAGGGAQPARGSCACRLSTVWRSRRIAASSSAVHGSQHVQDSSKVARPRRPPAWSSAIAR